MAIIDISSYLRTLLASGKELEENTLPTNRDIIQKSALEKDRLITIGKLDVRQVSNIDLAKCVAPWVSRVWRQRNPLFSQPIIINEKSIINKVLKLLVRACDIIRRRTSSKDGLRFVQKLDELFDLASCQHKLTVCQDEFSGRHYSKPPQ